MTEIEGSFEDAAGLERITIQRFYTANNVRRPSQAPIKFDAYGVMQLPTNSVLHSLNGFDTLVAPSDGLPDPKMPLVTNEKLSIYLKMATRLATEDSKPFGISDNYTYRPNTQTAQIGHFYQTHRKFKRIMSDRSLATMLGVLTWIDYSPLNEVKVSGTLHVYRKFDLLFRTILDSVVSIGAGKHHYVLLPQGNHVFARSLLQRSFSELTTSTLNPFLHDPSIFPVLHVLAFIYGKSHDLSITPYKEDVRILGKENALFETLKSTSLLERIPADLLGSINFIFQKEGKAVVYNLGDIARFAEDATFYSKFYRHMMNLRMASSMLPDHIDVDSDEFDSHVEDVAESGEPLVVVPPVVKAETTVPEVINPFVAPIVPEKAEGIDKVGQKVVPVGHSFEDKLRKAVIEHSAAAIEIEPKKEARRNVLLDNHLKATLNGKALGELVQAPATQKISPKAMSFITSTPEMSYQKSSLVSMDRAYQTHAYHHEMAKVVGSLAKHGMFISKVEEDKTHTEMDRTTTYRFHLSDLNGKTHHIKYTLPDVDDNGLMKLSGIEYRLTRQIANVPICKTAAGRVNLSSYYNKVIIERIQSKRYSYEADTTKLIMSLKARGLIEAIMGTVPLPTSKVAYDYSAIGRKFTEVIVNGYAIHFGYNHVKWEKLSTIIQSHVPADTLGEGTYVGQGNNGAYLVWMPDNSIRSVMDGKIHHTWLSFHRFLADQIGPEAVPERTPLEWTQANIINQTIPLVYILAYKFGLKSVLESIRLDYRFYTNKSEIEMNVDDIAIPMADGTLVFNRYPLSRSLIACGLAWTDLKSYNFRDLSVPDTYADVYAQKGMRVGVLKGLRGFFDFFVDPITESVLEKMHEPTTFGELLLRANVMLTDYHADESSSVKLHRFRLYERFNGTLYNAIYTALANHRDSPSTKKSFSINPEAVFQKIVRDATVSPNEVINPVHEVKQRANFTFTGLGGRMARSFTPKDLVYPQDGLGVISDAVPDSGKVGITAYLTASPNIDDIHGLPIPYKEGDVLTPPQLLSIGSMVMPGGTTDDGKRNSYLSIQISHYVPNHEDGETLAVRTGYDAVLPHLSSDVFAITASDNGVVDMVDDKQKVMRVRYADTPAVSLKSIKVPYLDAVLDKFRRDQTSFGYLIPDTDIASYPIGGIFALSKTTYAKVSDRLRCETVESIPDKEMARKQATLIHDLNKGKYKALYYLRFTPMGTTMPGEIKSYSFADVYSQNSGSYLLQKRVCHFKTGDKIKLGDILIYNSGFFVPDPMSKQVTFKHGVIANVALIEKSSNHEDACEISRELSERLKMTPCHQREIITKNDAAILGIVRVGDHVETSDSLCLISDEYLVGSSLKMNSENLDIVEKLNRQSPPADYTGTIVKIRLLYGGDREKLSESLKTILKTYEKEVRDNFKALNNNSAAKPPEKPGWVAPGTRYQGITFTNTTVIIEFMIEETLKVAEGDKVVIANANKSIVSYVTEKQHSTESGIPIDVLFSTTSVINRIVKSPFNGIGERNMAALKEQVLALYFEDKK